MPSVVQSVLRLGMGAMWVGAAIGKTIAPDTAWGNSVWGDPGVLLFRVVLPTCEFAIGTVMLCVPDLWRRACGVGVLLLILYSVGLWHRIVTEGLDALCACFGSWLPTSAGKALIRNVSLLGLSGLLLWLDTGRRRRSRRPRPT
jgi:hypothetical protein